MADTGPGQPPQPDHGSKDPDGPRLAFTAEAWDSFIEHIKHGQPGQA